MSKILVVSGHPRLNQSLANKTILETLKEKGADFTLLRLDEEGFAPQVEKDQALLKDADIIVFQFPIFWYSYPSLMKHWVEEVFAHGFAYGTGGTALKGKSSRFPLPPVPLPVRTGPAVPMAIPWRISFIISSRLLRSAVWSMRIRFIPMAVLSFPVSVRNR